MYPVVRRSGALARSESRPPESGAGEGAAALAGAFSDFAAFPAGAGAFAPGAGAFAAFAGAFSALAAFAGAFSVLAAFAGAFSAFAGAFAALPGAALSLAAVAFVAVVFPAFAVVVPALSARFGAACLAGFLVVFAAFSGDFSPLGECFAVVFAGVFSALRTLFAATASAFVVVFLPACVPATRLAAPARDVEVPAVFFGAAVALAVAVAVLAAAAVTFAVVAGASLRVLFDGAFSFSAAVRAGAPDLVGFVVAIPQSPFQRGW